MLSGKFKCGIILWMLSASRQTTDRTDPAKRWMQSDSTTSLPDDHTGAVCEFMLAQECTWKEVWPLNSTPIYLKKQSMAWFFLPSSFLNVFFSCLRCLLGLRAVQIKTDKQPSVGSGAV